LRTGGESAKKIEEDCLLAVCLADGPVLAPPDRPLEVLLKERQLRFDDLDRVELKEIH